MVNRQNLSGLISRMKRDGLIISIPKLRQMDVEPIFLQTPVSVSVHTAREQG